MSTGPRFTARGKSRGESRHFGVESGMGGSSKNRTAKQATDRQAYAGGRTSRVAGSESLTKRRTDEANSALLAISRLWCRVDRGSAPASTENVDGRCPGKSIKCH